MNGTKHEQIKFKEKEEPKSQSQHDFKPEIKLIKEPLIEEFNLKPKTTSTVNWKVN